MKTKLYSCKTIALIILLISYNYLLANDTIQIDKANIKRAEFIIEIANNIHYNSPKKIKDYKIGVFGKNREIRDLLKALNKITKNKTIDNKKIEILQFKRTNKIVPVDLIYITGESKIRLSELSERLKGRPYILLTENFPFGASSLNFAVNKKNDLFFEIHEEFIEKKGAIIKKAILNSPSRVSCELEWQQRLNAALITIKEKEKVIQKKDAKIQQQKKEITEKEIVVKKQTKVIYNLSIIITISIISLIIISFLVFELLKINKQKKQALKEITDSLNYAKRIQDSILSKENMYDKLFDNHFILFQPKNIVSGDFYWTTCVDNKIFFLVADCTGHGVPGAMLTLICHNALRKVIKEFKIHKPAKILDKTSEILEKVLSTKNYVNDGMDIALCCLNLNSNKLEFSGANNPLYYIKNNELTIIKGDKQPIGLYENKKPHTNHEIEYKKGDAFYLFSDGYADQFGGENDKKLNYKRLQNLLMQNHKKSMKEQKQSLINFLKKWEGETEQVDDICIMGVKI